MPMISTRRDALAILNGLAFSFSLGTAAKAQVAKAYGPGASDTEVVIGQTCPYSGPASALSICAKVQDAYFRMLNEQGGVNGRKIRFVSLDDGYSPPRALEQTRKLVEQDEVAAIFGVVGTPTSAAVQKYLNLRKVPQLFISGGGGRFFDPKNSPWTLSAAASLRMEALLHSKYLLRERPEAKIATLYQNDDYGKDYLNGLTEGLGEYASKMMVSTVPYETTDPTVDSQILKLKSSGADVLIYYCSPKAAAQAIRKTREINWEPTRLLATGSRSISTVLTPAGLENATGLLSLNRFRDLEDPAVQHEADVKEYLQFMEKYCPSGHPTEAPEAYGYLSAFLMAETLRRCGDVLTRENIMKQATSFKDLTAPFLLNGATISTSPTDYEITKKMIFSRFDGKRWAPFGQPIGL